MWHNALSVVLIILAAVVPALWLSQAAGAADAKDESIDGTWLPATAELGGKPFPEAILKTMKLVMKDGKYTATVGPGVDAGTVKVNSSAKPKEIDVTGVEGPNKGRTFLCIYEWVGGDLRICYDLSGQGRPTEFKSKDGTKLYLVTYKRERR